MRSPAIPLLAGAIILTAGTEAQPGDVFDEEVSGIGDEVAVTFHEPGTYAYFCVLHPFMTGVVEVKG